MLGADSSLCLSCHDGTVAVGQTQPYGQIQMSGQHVPGRVFGTDLQGSHPFSLKTAAGGCAGPGAVAGHEPHDGRSTAGGEADQQRCGMHELPYAARAMHRQVSKNFLVRDSSSGQLCLSCHEPNPRTVNGQSNPLAQWPGSIHATAGNAIANGPMSGKLLDGRAERVPVVPHAAQLGGGSALAARSGSGCGEHGCLHAELHDLPQRRLQHLAGDPEYLCGVFQDRASVSGGHQSARCGRAGAGEQQPACDLRGLPQPARLPSSEFICVARCLRRFVPRRRVRSESARPTG